MNQEISKRDWETISAYMDGQLPPKKLTRFESRLSQEPALQVALDELLTARYVLQNTPRLRPPKNFFLTLEMVGKPRRLPRLAPAFGWASALASLLFVFVMIGGLLNTGKAIPLAAIDIPQPVSFSSESVSPSVTAQTTDETAAVDVAAAGGFSEAAQPEIVADEVVPQVAAVPEMDAAPKELAPEEPTEPAEVFALAEEPSPQPDMEFAAEAPLTETDAVASETIAETSRSDQTEELMDASAALLPTPTETIPVQEGGHHIEKTATKEVVFAEPEIIITTVLPPSQPTAMSTPIPEQSEPSAADVGPIDDDQGAMNLAETTSESDWGAAAFPEEQSSPQVSEDKVSNILLGVELLLVLFAFGTGIAWIYLRRGG